MQLWKSTLLVLCALLAIANMHCAPVVFPSVPASVAAVADTEVPLLLETAAQAQAEAAAETQALDDPVTAALAIDVPDPHTFLKQDPFIANLDSFKPEVHVDDAELLDITTPHDQVGLLEVDHTPAPNSAFSHRMDISRHKLKPSAAKFPHHGSAAKFPHHKWNPHRADGKKSRRVRTNRGKVQKIIPAYQRRAHKVRAEFPHHGGHYSAKHNRNHPNGKRRSKKKKPSRHLKERSRKSFPHHGGHAPPSRRNRRNKRSLDEFRFDPDRLENLQTEKQNTAASVNQRLASQGVTASGRRVKSAARAAKRLKKKGHPDDFAIYQRGSRNVGRPRRKNLRPRTRVHRSSQPDKKGVTTHRVHYEHPKQKYADPNAHVHVFKKGHPALRATRPPRAKKGFLRMIPRRCVAHPEKKSCRRVVKKMRRVMPHHGLARLQWLKKHGFTPRQAKHFTAVIRNTFNRRAHRASRRARRASRRGGFRWSKKLKKWVRKFNRKIKRFGRKVAKHVKKGLRKLKALGKKFNVAPKKSIKKSTNKGTKKITKKITQKSIKSPKSKGKSFLEISKKPRAKSKFSRSREKMDLQQSDFQDQFDHIKEKRSSLRSKHSAELEAKRMLAEAKRVEREAAELDAKNKADEAAAAEAARAQSIKDNTKAGADTGVHDYLPTRRRNGKLYRFVPDRLKLLEDLRLKLRREKLQRGEPPKAPEGAPPSLMEIDASVHEMPEEVERTIQDEERERDMMEEEEDY